MLTTGLTWIVQCFNHFHRSMQTGNCFDNVVVCTQNTRKKIFSVFSTSLSYKHALNVPVTLSNNFDFYKLICKLCHVTKSVTLSKMSQSERLDAVKEYRVFRVFSVCSANRLWAVNVITAETANHCFEKCRMRIWVTAISSFFKAI